jgi:hypothetical protein
VHECVRVVQPAQRASAPQGPGHTSRSIATLGADRAGSGFAWRAAGGVRIYSASVVQAQHTREREKGGSERHTGWAARDGCPMCDAVR